MVGRVRQAALEKEIETILGLLAVLRQVATASL
jgi:hypothetical protein